MKRPFGAVEARSDDGEDGGRPATASRRHSTLTDFVSSRQADAAVSGRRAATAEIAAPMSGARLDTAQLSQRSNESRLSGPASIRVAHAHRSSIRRRERPRPRLP
ncbi:hypothetical protein ACXHMN_07900 [Rhizobium sp. LEGMi12c]